MEGGRPPRAEAAEQIYGFHYCCSGPLLEFLLPHVACTKTPVQVTQVADSLPLLSLKWHFLHFCLGVYLIKTVNWV